MAKKLKINFNSKIISNSTFVHVNVTHTQSYTNPSLTHTRTCEMSRLPTNTTLSLSALVADDADCQQVPLGVPLWHLFRHYLVLFIRDPRSRAQPSTSATAR